jgi:hypothetical protein
METPPSTLSPGNFLAFGRGPEKLLISTKFSINYDNLEQVAET